MQKHPNLNKQLEAAREKMRWSRKEEDSSDHCQREKERENFLEMDQLVTGYKVGLVWQLYKLRWRRNGWTKDARAGSRSYLEGSSSVISHATTWKRKLQPAIEGYEGSLDEMWIPWQCGWFWWDMWIWGWLSCWDKENLCGNPDIWQRVPQDLVEKNITREIWQQKWKKNKMATSPSVSTLHFGHHISGAHSE